MNLSMLENYPGIINCTPNLNLNREIEGVIACDLLSWVMGNGQKDEVWITVMSHINVLAVASLCEFSAIIVSHGAVIEEEVIKKALLENVVIFRSDKSTYELATIFYKEGVL